MPNIIEYNATGDITPSDKGIQAAEAAGSSIGRSFRQMGATVGGVADAVDRHMAVMETSELYKTGTELKLNLQKRYEQESALPENRNDPHFGDRFMAEISPLFDQWGSGAGTEHGRTLAATMKAQIRNDIFNHVAAGQSAMDFAHVVENSDQTHALLKAGLAMDPSEANLDKTIGMQRDAIQGMTMAIPDVGMRERLATELTSRFIPDLVLSRYKSVAETIKNQVAETGNPAQSLAYEQMGKDIAAQVDFQYMPGTDPADLEQLRDQAVQQGQQQFRAGQADQQRQEANDVAEALTQVDSEMYVDNGAGGVTVRSSPEILRQLDHIAQMPGAKYKLSDIRSYRAALHTATQNQIDRKETVTDRATYMTLAGQIGSTSSPLTKARVDDAYAKGLLSNRDYSFLRGAAADSKSANPKINHAMAQLHHQLSLIKPMIDKSSIYSGIDQSGAAQFSYLSYDAEQMLLAKIAAGADPDQAYRDLADPRSPTGIYAIAHRYQTSNKQGLQNVTRAVLPGGGQSIPAPPVAPKDAASAVKPGESMDGWIKRTGHR